MKIGKKEKKVGKGVKVVKGNKEEKKMKKDKKKKSKNKAVRMMLSEMGKNELKGLTRVLRAGFAGGLGITITMHANQEPSKTMEEKK